MDSQESPVDVLSLPVISEPATPQPAHTTIPASTAAAISKVQSNRIEKAANGTPPPSAQRSSTRAKTRTPTPTVSHMSTPPPTIEAPSLSQVARLVTPYGAAMTPDEIAVASAEDLRFEITGLHVTLHEAKVSAAHHRLQYKMLAQESAATIERMAVEARMAQHESDIIHMAEQSKAAAVPVQPPPIPEGMIPVHKDLYQRMTLDIRQLQDANRRWENEYAQQERLIGKQEGEIASLSDKVTLMRERIRENREHLNKVRGRGSAHLESTPRSLYGTPNRSQGLEALLQASEMTNPDLRPHKKGGHSRNTHSLSSLPVTPQRSYKPGPALMYETPSGRQLPSKVPATAPMPRTSSMRTPNAGPGLYTEPILPVLHRRGSASEGTVSASEAEGGDTDNDSEAETDILGHNDTADDTLEISESQASRAASQMLRSGQQEQQQAKLTGSFERSTAGMLGGSGNGAMKQTRLFGAVRKGNVERVVAGSDVQAPPAKRPRMSGPSGEETGMGSIGLGISGMRE
ncbi:hypothetical protein LTR91_015841 [Friedmanniomyces endolithicus]|uniref:Uncharacterized protein n=1 Tax=Friedmanniomyces endolithicus TaxID=329885 RepID=A0AAN6F3T1_9PEZI|nr:hypothetical protein LTR82_017671 [Friedmanniomyces endolithicus]KAK0904933.1 hypothetical protein LTR57_018492 [Friedmanniomyces endolithicus]KAK0970686.1 hypothetical protein LTR91_015841 [Friedmanniomyces endolithicus]KAK1001260.1 hypothetical protein LTS01_004734 [Friedmanniomyces endolithicus]KAK1031411.1 hypothetical protein LTS16_018024 [Friedmanniomyces endolithicus]